MPYLFATREWEGSMKRTEVCIRGKLSLTEIYVSSMSKLTGNSS